LTKFTTYKKSTSKKGGEIGEYKIFTLIESISKDNCYIVQLYNYDKV